MPIVQQASVVGEHERGLPDYQEASISQGCLIIGKPQDVLYYKRNSRYAGRVLHPERRGEEWSYESNKAFIMAGIESGKEFLIVTTFDFLLHCCHLSMKGHGNRDSLGFAVCEILWLQDHGYTFEVDKERSHLIRAIPSEAPIRVDAFREYGFICDPYVWQQIGRLGAIRDSVHGMKSGRPSRTGMWVRREVDMGLNLKPVLTIPVPGFPAA